MKNLLKLHSVEKEPLYDAIWWGMEGYATCDNHFENEIPVGEFLELLLNEEFSSISGEPGWTIVRMKLDDNLLTNYPDLTIEEIALYETMRESGKTVAYHVHNSVIDPEYSDHTSAAFWAAVKESLNGFKKQYPKRTKEVNEVLKRYNLDK